MIRLMDLLSSGRSACCWGVGFVAMDVVDVENERFAAVGGSCGNVIALLAWLGWTARPIARLGGDATGDFIHEELRGLGVDVTSLTQEKEVRSPVVLQRFDTARDGTRTHRFSLTCPGCGRWLPRHRSVTLAQSKSLACGGDAPNVFYFDRVSPASLQLAETARSRDALVVFEPSSADLESKFQRAVDACHVLKFSQERLGHLPDLPYAASPALIVETRGEAGLRYRWEGRWSQLDAFSGGRHCRRRRERGLVHGNADPSDGTHRCQTVHSFDGLGDRGCTSRRPSNRSGQLRFPWRPWCDAGVDAG